MPLPVSIEEWRGATVIFRGTPESRRRWPRERWDEVARAETRRGRKVLVVDLDETERIPELLQVAGRFVSADTAVARRAVELGTPSVTLYGSDEPDHKADPEHICLWHGRHICLAAEPHGTDPGLLSLEVDEVVEALDRLN